jgi:4-amino-4-deoxychorismate lyase
MERIFLGEDPLERLPGYARGFAYGDGVFETMRVHRGTVPWWTVHLARLSNGLARLRIPSPDAASMERAIASLFADGGDGVAKLIVSRGGVGRGYAPDFDAPPLWRVSRHELPPPPRAEGLVLRWCETRLAQQPALAGLKHCNRLEHVVARGEWSDPGIDEGLLRSIDDFVVCATSANLFVLHGDRWCTPRVDRCGIAGTCRAWLLSETQAAETRIDPRELETADAIALCNAVRGILPVARLESRTWAPHPAIADLRRRLARAHPAFAQEMA